MGIETLLIASLAVGAAGTIHQASLASRQQRLQREGNRITQATNDFQNRLSRRQAIREARIRRARIANSAEVTGSSGSSGELGASSSVGASLGVSIAEQQRDILAKNALTDINQQVSNINYKMDRSAAFVGLAQTALNMGVKYKTGQYGDIFGD